MLQAIEFWSRFVDCRNKVSVYLNMQTHARSFSFESKTNDLICIETASNHTTQKS